MGLFVNIKTDSYHLGIWKIEETTEELLDLLPEKEYYAAEIERFKTLHRMQEWLSVRALLYKLLGFHVRVFYHESGKPYIPDYFISISHTKGYVAVMLSDIGEVGVDIEYYSQRVHKVASKYMRDDEVASAFQGDNTWGLLLHWSAKEAMFKVINYSEIDFREHLHILPFEIAEEGTFHAHEYKTAQSNKYKIHYLINSDFVLTWVECVS